MCTHKTRVFLVVPHDFVVCVVTCITCCLGHDCSIRRNGHVFCRLGVRSAELHDVYSPAVTQALKSALLQFDKKLPGFNTEAGLLHGVETRTSSPVSGLICIRKRKATVYAGRRVWEALDRPWRSFSASVISNVFELH